MYLSEPALIASVTWAKWKWSLFIMMGCDPVAAVPEAELEVLEAVSPPDPADPVAEMK